MNSSNYSDAGAISCASVGRPLPRGCAGIMVALYVRGGIAVRGMFGLLPGDGPWRTVQVVQDPLIVHFPTM